MTHYLLRIPLFALACVGLFVGLAGICLCLPFLAVTVREPVRRDVIERTPCATGRGWLGLDEAAVKHAEEN